jgi:hypothetical protein
VPHDARDGLPGDGDRFTFSVVRLRDDGGLLALNAPRGVAVGRRCRPRRAHRREAAVRAGRPPGVAHRVPAAAARRAAGGDGRGEIELALLPIDRHRRAERERERDRASHSIAEHRCLFVNRFFREGYGWKREEAPGRTAMALHGPDGLTRLPLFQRDMLAGVAAAHDDAALGALCHNLKTILFMRGRDGDARLAMAVEASMGVDRIGALCRPGSWFASRRDRHAGRRMRPSTRRAPMLHDARRTRRRRSAGGHSPCTPSPAPVASPPSPPRAPRPLSSPPRPRTRWRAASSPRASTSRPSSPRRAATPGSS